MRKRYIRLSALLFGLLLMAACGARRPAQIGVDANYVLEVTNPTTHAMSVSLDLGANQMSALGSVGAGETKRFEIRDPATNDINLVATDGSGTHTVRKTVELKRGTVARVTLD
ncbi:MAG TPA: hypothetical protein VFO52_00085 [Longimicrobiales bacterium]|nr:hypothetical protein [Longimicrobiales bacterium]